MVKLTTEQNSIGTKAEKKKVSRSSYFNRKITLKNGLITAANTLSRFKMSKKKK